MGWKGTVRSIGSAVRAAERDAMRRQRKLDKIQELEQAEYEVDVYENHIKLVSRCIKSAVPLLIGKKLIAH